MQTVFWRVDLPLTLEHGTWSHMMILVWRSDLVSYIRIWSDRKYATYLGECTLFVHFLVLVLPVSKQFPDERPEMFEEMSSTWWSQLWNMECFKCLSVGLSVTSGHDFRCHFWSWLPVPLLVMTFGATSGHDSVMAPTTSGTISDYDFWQYHVALNWCILDCIKNSVSQSS